MKPARAGLLLGALLLLFFSPVVLRGRLLAPPGDGLSYYYPMRVHAAEIVAGGRLPLWSPAIFAGFPLLADVEVGVLYPPNALFLVLPAPLAFNVLVLLTYLLAGVSTFSYCRAIGAASVGALAAAVSYMLGGFMVSHLGHITILQAAAWLPLALFFLERLRREASGAAFGGLAATLALLVLGGHPQIVLGSLLLCALYGVGLGLLVRPAIGRLRFVSRAVASALLGGLLAAAQWLPTLELAGRSVRAALSYESFVDYSLPPSHLLTLLFPFFFGAPLAGPWFQPWWGHWTETEMLGYLGVAPLLLAPLALARAVSPHARFWAAAALLFLALALGGHTPLAPLLHGLPGFNAFRAPARHQLFFGFALAVLSALGATRLMTERHTRPLLRTGLALLLLLVAGWLALGHGLFAPRWLSGVTPPRPEEVFSPANPALLLPLALGLATLGAWWLVARRPRLAPLALSLLVFDVGLLGQQGFWHGASPLIRELGGRLPAAQALAELAPAVQSHRFLSQIDEQNAPLLNGLHDAGGSSSLAPTRQLELLGGMDANGYVFDSYRLHQGRALDLLSVRYLLVPLELVRPEPRPSAKGLAATRERYEIPLSAGRLDVAELLLPAVRCSALRLVASTSEAPPRDGDPVLRLALTTRDGRRLERILAARRVSRDDLRPGAFEARAELGGTFEVVSLRVESLISSALDLHEIRWEHGRLVLRLSDEPPVPALLPRSRRWARARAAGVPAGELRLTSALSRALRLEQGQPVARIRVHGRDGRELERLLRAGLHTSEWAWDRLDVRWRVRHDRAPVAHSARAGWFHLGHRYRARLPLGPALEVESLEIEYLATTGALDIHELSLHDPAADATRALQLDRTRLEADPEPRTFALDHAPVRAAHVELVTALENAVLTADEEPVAQVEVELDDGGRREFVLRAGSDTSEWAWDRRDVRTQVRHRRAPVFRSYPAGGGAFEGHWYLTRLDLDGERLVRGLRLRSRSPHAGLALSQVRLESADGRWLPVYQREAPLHVAGRALPLRLLGAGSTPSVTLTLPPTDARALIVVSSLRHAASLAQGQPVARLTVGDVAGGVQHFLLEAGVHSSEWAWDDPAMRGRLRHARAPRAEVPPGEAASGGDDFLARFELSGTPRVSDLTLTYLAPEALLLVRALSLVGSTPGLALPVSLSGSALADASRWRLRHAAGGVAIYENLRALPRAWLVPRVARLPAADVLRAIRAGTLPDGSPFDPQSLALIEEGEGRELGPLDPHAELSLVVEPGRLRLESRSRTPAFAVVSESFAPGWRATLDGAPLEPVRADYVLLGLPLPAGSHHVELVYDPRSFRRGAAASAAGVLALLAWRLRRRPPSDKERRR